MMDDTGRCEDSPVRNTRAGVHPDSQEAVDDDDPMPLVSPRGPTRHAQSRSEGMPTTHRTLRSSVVRSSLPNPSQGFDFDDSFGLVGGNWNLEPASLTPLTMEYLGLYFTMTSQAVHCMLPRGPFLKWVRESRDKTEDHKMLLYALIALGSRFSTRLDSISHGKTVLQMGRYIEQSSFGRVTLPLVQARLILAVVHLSQGDCRRALEYCNTAVRSIRGLGYHTESGVSTDMLHGFECEYGLEPRAMAECRRRTFWSAYLIHVCILRHLLWPRPHFRCSH
jgi:hypothetical protein